MNLSTRRLSQAELNNWAKMGKNEVWTFRVSDRFGDYGLTAMVSLSFGGRETVLEDFILSCRVMGRKVEEALLHFAVARAAEAGSKRLVFWFRQTERNTPILEFFSQSILERTGDEFSWSSSSVFPLPHFITLINDEDV